tara:strand:- start:49868 stop:50491 length:624 start_codon:yes stop_codon:yes gene_type:complete
LIANPVVDLAVSIPAWAVRSPVESLTLGDLVILSDDSWGFFVELKSTGSHEAADFENPTISIVSVENGKQSTVSVPINSLFGTPGLLVVRNIVGGQEMGNALPMLLMLEGKKKKGNIGRLIAMSMMMGGGEGAGAGLFSNPMMMMAMMGDDGDCGMDKNMMMMLMMMQQGGGDGEGGGLNMNSMLPMMMMGGFGNSSDDEYEDEDDE